MEAAKAISGEEAKQHSSVCDAHLQELYSTQGGLIILYGELARKLSTALENGKENQGESPAAGPHSTDMSHPVGAASGQIDQQPLTKPTTPQAASRPARDGSQPRGWTGPNRS
eukprot:comp16154_c0_seq1/m.13753 comp16154_c0_seq1/g.13753  ORF comp16154_c0_seq1/g.13753 comp16154_c0_seq1/m.13753 type:complete len:113 (-) comp16154_c0_seq1:23-361(-)